MRTFCWAIVTFALMLTSCKDNRTPLADNGVAGSLTAVTEKNDTPEVSTNFSSPDSLEFPCMVRTVPEQLLKRLGYTCSYNKETRCANWVAWYLTKEHVEGKLKSKRQYVEDEHNVVNRQELTDWEEVSDEGFDHGHLCPAGDNKWSYEAYRQSFYLSNMCVQNSQLNQGTWEHLESVCRIWAKTYGAIYIVAGPLYTRFPRKKIGNELTVPDSFFKVILCTIGEPKAIGFIYANIAPEKKEKLESHVVSIDEVERLSGFDFFYLLPDSIENRIERQSNVEDWRVF